MWTDEKKKEVIEAYVKRNPTAENSVEIVKELAEEYEETANGVRMILSKAEVYVKKGVEATKPAGEKKAATGGGKGSKADAVTELTTALTDAGQTPDMEIIDKLTGKAALYFAKVVSAINK